jgi:hypothetical protein
MIPRGTAETTNPDATAWTRTGTRPWPTLLAANGSGSPPPQHDGAVNRTIYGDIGTSIGHRWIIAERGSLHGTPLIDRAPSVLAPITTPRHLGDSPHAAEVGRNPGRRSSIAATGLQARISIRRASSIRPASLAPSSEKGSGPLCDLRDLCDHERVDLRRSSAWGGGTLGLGVLGAANAEQVMRGRSQ